MNSTFLKRIRLGTVVSFAVLLTGANLARAQDSPPYKINAALFVVSPPPPPGSPVEQNDLKVARDWQARRTTDQCKLAASQPLRGLSKFFFTGGPLLKPTDFDRFAPFLTKVMDLAIAVADPIQQRFKRQRPFAMYADIQPCVDRPTTYSYPSTHTMTGYLQAKALSAVFPQNAPALMHLGLQMGLNRIIGGAHYLSDVKAGENLAAQVWQQLSNDPEFKLEVAKLKQGL